jgi:hypothetical protein
MNTLQQLRQYVDGLGRRSTPHYGQLLLLIVLSLALWIGHSRISEVDRSIREAARATGQPSGEAATVLSFLPEPLLRDEGLIGLCAVVFILASLLWLAQLLLPWSSSTSAIAFTALLALHWENTVKLSHHVHVINMVLIVLALWYGLYAQEIRAALRAGRFWTTPLLPSWVHALCVFYLGIVYGAAGLEKLFYSGFAWMNGVSLQCWIFLLARDRPLAHLVLSDIRLALALQAITLLAELAALIAIFWRPLRVPVGLALIGFHFGSTFLMGLNFTGNVILLALVFLPAREALEAFMSRRLRPAGPQTLIFCPKSFFSSLGSGIRTRLNVFGQWQPEEKSLPRNFG